jgi:hypothetical protein
MGNSTGSFFGSDWLGAFLIIAVLFGGFGGFGFGGRGENYATTEYVQSAINNQATQTGLRDILLSSANNNYETAQLINGQTNALMQQGYTYQLSAEQRFNALQQQIAQIGYQMDSCCCSIKTQMLQDKYEALETKYLAAQNDLSNAAQSQYILNALGRFVAYPPVAAAAATAG